ncbi:MAG: phosphate/phosphite/phosphonate ABC transporter substrate-binding protein [Acidimicrobiia bacterium]|nr:MAG: phosphate/phosphite/phosphonate ABC transporter substrate-binding protein [Acidimicrobiia bacterium]
MRVRRLLGLVLVLALVAAACGDDDTATTTTAADTTTTAASSLTQKEGVLTVGSDIPWEPFEFFDDSGEVLGFDADLINEMASRLGLTVEWVDTDFDTIFTQLATGRFDVVASGTTITEQRSQQVNFTVPYYRAQQALTVNTDETPFIDGTEDLGAGDSVAVQTGTTGADWAAANLTPQGVEVVEFLEAPDTYNALEAGQVTGVIFDLPSAVAEAANRAGLEVVQVIDTDEDYGFGVDPERTELLAQLNAALEDMFEDGTYQAIYDAWFDAPAGSVLYEEPAPVALGTEDNPIQVLFVPSVSAEEIIAGGELLAEALNEATGLFFEVSVPTSYAATVEAMCAAPDSTMGFIPAQAYVLANDLCGVEMVLKAERFNYTEYWTQFIVARDSAFESIEDLAGASWAYPDGGSTSGFLVPSGMFETLGIEPGETVEAGGHTAVVKAVYNGEADFGTTFFSPIIDLDGNDVWDGTAENADIPADAIESCGLVEGDLVCGDLRPRDARRNVREELPDVIQKVRILALSEPIPNDGLAFGPEFPDDLQGDIVAALKAFAADDPDGFATAFDAYSWSSVTETDDSEFDVIRALLEALGFDLDDL